PMCRLTWAGQICIFPLTRAELYPIVVYRSGWGMCKAIRPLISTKLNPSRGGGGKPWTSLTGGRRVAEGCKDSCPIGGAILSPLAPLTSPGYPSWLLVPSSTDWKGPSHEALATFPEFFGKSGLLP